MTQSLLLFLFLLACTLPVLLMLYVTERNETKPKKGLILGVTLPPEGQALPEVQAVVARFKKELNLVCLVFLAAFCLLFWVKSSWLLFTLWLLLLLVGCALPALPHVRANRALKAIKKQHGWQGARPAHRVVDTAAAASLPKPLGVGAILPPLALCLLPLLGAALDYTGTERLLWVLFYGSDTAAVLLLWACGRWMFRRRVDMVSDDTALNQTLLRVRHLYWNRCWVLCMWGCAGLNLGIWLFAAHPAVELAVTVAASVLLLAAVLWAELGARRAQERLTSQAAPRILADEDDAWLGGILYYDPTDARMVVSNRVGIGTTVNLASRGGRLLTGVSAALLLAALLIGPAMGFAEQARTALQVKDGTLSVTHITEKYSIPLADITAAELHDALPPATRTWGTGLDRYLSGTFTMQGYGSCQLCLDPTVPPFLYVKAGGTGYWLGASDPDETRAAAQALQNSAAGQAVLPAAG